MTEDGLYDRNYNFMQGCLVGLVVGSSKVKKLPRKPKSGQRYWVPQILTTAEVCSYVWQDRASDEAVFNLGIVRYTEDDAIDLIRKMLEVANETTNT